VVLSCPWQAHSMPVGELLMSQRRWGSSRARPCGTARYVRGRPARAGGLNRPAPGRAATPALPPMP
jgi:hypothetical protein